MNPKNTDDYDHWAKNITKKELLSCHRELSLAHKRQSDELMVLRSEFERIQKEYTRIYEGLKKAHVQMPDLSSLLTEFFINLTDSKL